MPKKLEIGGMLLNQTLKIIAKSVTPGNTVFVVPARLDVVLTTAPLKAVFNEI